MKRILITGATGFIGSRFARAACARQEIHALVRPSSDAAFLDSPGAVRLHPMDGGTEAIAAILDEVRPEAVVHIASKFCAQHAPGDIRDLVDTTILFGTQVLDAMSRCGCRKFLGIGSSWQHYENRVYDPVNLYAATKQAFYDIIKYYENAHDLVALNIELFDTYGPGDTRKKLLHLLKAAATDGRRLALSPGAQIIDLLHVEDVVRGLLVALDRLDGMTESGTFVLRSGERMSLRRLVELCRECSTLPIDVAFGERPYREREVMVPWENGIVLPGWEPRVSLKKGLKSFFAETGE